VNWLKLDLPLCSISEKQLTRNCGTLLLSLVQMSTSDAPNIGSATMTAVQQLQLTFIYYTPRRVHVNVVFRSRTFSLQHWVSSTFITLGLIYQSLYFKCEITGTENRSVCQNWLQSCCTEVFHKDEGLEASQTASSTSIWIRYDTFINAASLEIFAWRTTRQQFTQQLSNTKHLFFEECPNSYNSNSL